MPPPLAPRCTISACDPFNVVCETVEDGDRIVTDYDMFVQTASGNSWIQHSCGSAGGKQMNCEIAHSWLKEHTGHNEGDMINVKVRAFNRYGWGAHSSVLKVKLTSKPVTRGKYYLSENYETISWDSCKAADCEYKIRLLHPAPLSGS